MKKFILIVSMLVIVLTLVGCGNGATDNGDPNDNEIANGNEAANGSDAFSISALEAAENISAEWNESTKKFAQPNPAGRDACAACHDGTVYATGVFTDPEEFDDLRIHTTGLDCQACHTGTGKEVMDSGVVSLAWFDDNDINHFFDADYSAGTAALCISCHTGRQDPVANRDSQSGAFVHYAAPAAINTGLGGMEYAGVDYASTAIHANLQDSCVSCHMPETEDGYKVHSFAPDNAYIDNACGTCHPGWTDFNETGLKDTVAVNLELLNATIVDFIDGAVSVSFGRGGGVEMEDGDTVGWNDESVPLEAYIAAYNYYLILNDGGAYAHNPAYVKSLMDESLKGLSGETFDW